MTVFRVVLAVLVVAVSACGSSSSAGTPSPSESPSPSASPSALACTNAGPASSDWPAAASTSAAPAVTSVSATGDALTIAFAQGTPAFDVVPQSNVHFVMDPSGLPADVAGNAGVAIELRGFPTGGQANFVGTIKTTSLGPLLKDVKKIGDFEGVVTFAAGLAAPGCANVTSSGSTLTFRFVSS